MCTHCSCGPIRKALESKAVRQAKLIRVEGNQSEFSDLIGHTGRLRIDPNNLTPNLNWFNANGDIVQLARARVTENGKEVKVFTTLGNVFVFNLE